MSTPSPSISPSPSQPPLKECPSGKRVEIIARNIKSGILEKFCYTLNNIKYGVYPEIIYDSDNDIYTQDLRDKNKVRIYTLQSVRNTDPDVKIEGTNSTFSDVKVTNADVEFLNGIKILTYTILSDNPNPNPRPNPRPQPVDQTDPNIGMYVGIAMILFILGGGGLFFFFYLKSQSKVISKVASKVTKKIINKGGMFAIGY